MRSLTKTRVTFVLVLVLVLCSAASAQQPCTPGVSFWSLLGSVNVGHRDSRLGIDRLYAICLPTPSKQSASNYPYDPDGGGKLTTQVKTADGKVLNTYVWYGENISGLWELSRYKVLGGYEAVRPLSAGKYLLEFAIDDKPFYRFPFSVVEGKNTDPYQPAGSRYFIDGPWSEYGNIFYQRNDPQSPLRFTTWIQDRSGLENKVGVPYELKLVRLRDNKVIGEDKGKFGSDPRWLKADLLLRPAGGDPHAYMKAAELLAEDGDYAVRLSLNGKSYGDYRFTVKTGKIQFQGKQVRETTDPQIFIVDYLSGGRYSSWWIPRVR